MLPCCLQDFHAASMHFHAAVLPPWSSMLPCHQAAPNLFCVLSALALGARDAFVWIVTHNVTVEDIVR